MSDSATNMIIRDWNWPTQLSSSDRAAVADMLAASVADDGILGYASPVTQQQGEAFCEQLQHGIENGELLVLIGEDDSGVFGMCVVATTAMLNCRHIAEVSKAYLHPRVRRSTAVLELVLQVCKRLEAEGVERIRIDVREESPAHRVWQRFGFQTYGILEDYSRMDGVSYRGHFMTHLVETLGQTAADSLERGRQPSGNDKTVHPKDPSSWESR